MPDDLQPGAEEPTTSAAAPEPASEPTAAAPAKKADEFTVVKNEVPSVRDSEGVTMKDKEELEAFLNTGS